MSEVWLPSCKAKLPRTIRKSVVTIAIHENYTDIFMIGCVDSLSKNQSTVAHHWVIKAYIPPERKISGVGGWRWAMPPMPVGI